MRCSGILGGTGSRRSMPIDMCFDLKLSPSNRCILDPSSTFPVSSSISTISSSIDSTWSTTSRWKFTSPTRMKAKRCASTCSWTLMSCRFSFSTSTSYRTVTQLSLAASGTGASSQVTTPLSSRHASSPPPKITSCLTSRFLSITSISWVLHQSPSKEQDTIAPLSSTSSPGFHRTQSLRNS